MRRLLPLGVACGLLSLASPSGAATPRYSSFGNLDGVGDCQYETAANLILHEFPSANVTTSEVESAYNTNGGAFISPLWEGQQFLVSQGFDGHTARLITQVTDRSSIIAAANSGGVEVTNLGPVRMHMFAIIAANRTHVVIVDDGFVYHYSWAWLDYAYTQDGETLTYYAVKWSN